MTWMLLVVPLAPLGAAAITAMAGAAGMRAAGARAARMRAAAPRALAERGGWLVTAACAVSLAFLLVMGPAGRSAYLLWASPGGHALTVGLMVDDLSWLMAVLVAALALLVNAYAITYMARTPGRARFFAWMGVFAGAMLALVLSSSLLLLFAAWELVGLASFALIGFHGSADAARRANAARRAARKALLVTRAGDLGLLLAWLLALLALGTTDIAALLAAAQPPAASVGAVDPSAAVDPTVPVDPTAALGLIAALALIAALGKSAQLPLTMWLPDAMIGPTPVSALLHSATMVAAGVYLLLRLFPLFEAAPGVLDALAWLGLATALFAALMATAAHDLKRILAWSTASQLGTMMLALGLGAAAAAVHHLVAHAVIKAGLFLAAGIVATTGTAARAQDPAVDALDLHALGGLARSMPVTAAGFAACALALAAVPPLAGYWSETAVLAAAAARGPGWAVVLVLVVFLAALYIGRATAAVLAIWPGARAPGTAPDAPREAEAAAGLLVPLLILATGALAMGWTVEAPIARIPGFAPVPHPLAWGWTLALIAASLGGLTLGTIRVLGRGPVPALGAWMLGAAQALDRATRAPAVMARAAARALQPAEAGLDGAARRLGRGARAGARALDAAERAFDRQARATARGVATAARAVATTEARVFAGGGNALARVLGRAGQGLRRLESGKVYLYLLGLFGWVLLAGAAAAIFWSR